MGAAEEAIGTPREFLAARTVMLPSIRETGPAGRARENSARSRADALPLASV